MVLLLHGSCTMALLLHTPIVHLYASHTMVLLVHTSVLMVLLLHCSSMSALLIHTESLVLLPIHTSWITVQLSHTVGMELTIHTKYCWLKILTKNIAWMEIKTRWIVVHNTVLCPLLIRLPLQLQQFLFLLFMNLCSIVFKIQLWNRKPSKAFIWSLEIAAKHPEILFHGFKNDRNYMM